VLHESFGITKGLMTTIHSYTNDQVLLDIVHKDIRRARAAALNMIPTTTGAAKLVGRLVAGLEGKIHGYSLRVPTPTVSIIDFVCNTQKDVTVEQVNEAFKKATAGKLKGIMEYCDEKLVSMDFKGNDHSSIISAPDTMVIGGNMVKILAWYDNEWGYSCRLGDLAVYIAKKGL
jgi:glyceraldehyde 3-phosphate dehydrogenase